MMTTTRVRASMILFVAAFVIGCNNGGTVPSTSTAPAAEEQAQSTVNRITVEHVKLTTSKPFGEVTTAFVARLGTYDAPAATAALAGDPAAARTKLSAMAGPSGFMLFATQDHGTLLRVAGRSQKALQYVVGNPMFAVEMTQHAIGAALYAPLRVLIYEADGKTCVEYDRPSSLFGQFGNAQTNQMATTLDQKLEALINSATR